MTPPVSERATTGNELRSFGVESGRFPHPFTKGTDWDHYEGAKDDPERDTGRIAQKCRSSFGVVSSPRVTLPLLASPG